jgi:hypothetical protein
LILVIKFQVKKFPFMIKCLTANVDDIFFIMPILGLWWIILLRAYGKCSGDLSVQERIDVQTGIKMILRLCLADGFDMFPTLLVTDGSCMIDRRMGIHGHPLEIQVIHFLVVLDNLEAFPKLKYPANPCSKGDSIEEGCPRGKFGCCPFFCQMIVQLNVLNQFCDYEIRIC